MGITPSKPKFDDIISQLKRHNINIVKTHVDRRFRYCVMKRDELIFIVRQLIKTEQLSIKHADLGIFVFETIPEALDILNSIKKHSKKFTVTATLWDTENYAERELRFTFNTYDVREAAREYENLKAKLSKVYVNLGQLTPKMQAICMIPTVAVDDMKTMVVVDLGMNWHDYSKKMVRFSALPIPSPSYPSYPSHHR